MSVPQGTLYREPNLGLGHIADTSIQQVFTEPAAEEIQYGAPLAYTTDGEAVKTAGTADKVIGIARAFEGKMNDFGGFGTEQAGGTFQKDEAVSVLTTGSIVVAVSADVEKGQAAVVDADGKFKAAGTEATTTVGVFRTAGTAGKTAVLHINL